MNDLTILHDAWAAPEPPSPVARAQARAALVDRGTAHRRRTWRLLPRLAAIGAAALIVATGAAVLDELGGTAPDGLPSVQIASAAALERAAVAAERRPFVPPKPGQWIYVEDRATWQDGETEILRRWRAADGTGMAWMEDGELRVAHLETSKERPARVVVGPLAGYETLAALPTDPDALRRWAYRQARDITGAGLSEHGDVYAIFNGIVRDNVLPPALEAAIFRALKEVPGVTVENAEVAGRPALVVGQTEDWLREELLLDPETYAYRGERSTVTRDATIDPAKAGNAAGRIDKGQTVVIERIASAIVDEPGRRR